MWRNMTAKKRNTKTNKCKLTHKWCKATTKHDINHAMRHKMTTLKSQSDGYDEIQPGKHEKNMTTDRSCGDIILQRWDRKTMAVRWKMTVQTQGNKRDDKNLRGGDTSSKRRKTTTNGIIFSNNWRTFQNEVQMSQTDTDNQDSHEATLKKERYSFCRSECLRAPLTASVSTHRDLLSSLWTHTV